MMQKMTAPEMQAFLSSDFPQAAHFVVEAVTDTGVTVRRPVQEADLRPGGTVQGPTMFGLADVGAYLAILSRIGPVVLAVTTNASIDFMRKPAAEADLLAEVRLLKLGRALAVCDALISSDGVVAPVARASLTYSIPPKR